MVFASSVLGERSPVDGSAPSNAGGLWEIRLPAGRLLWLRLRIVWLAGKRLSKLGARVLDRKRAPCAPLLRDVIALRKRAACSE